MKNTKWFELRDGIRFRIEPHGVGLKSKELTCSVPLNMLRPNLARIMAIEYGFLPKDEWNCIMRLDVRTIKDMAKQYMDPISLKFQRRMNMYLWDPKNRKSIVTCRKGLKVNGETFYLGGCRDFRNPRLRQYVWDAVRFPSAMGAFVVSAPDVGKWRWYVNPRGDKGINYWLSNSKTRIPNQALSTIVGFTLYEEKKIEEASALPICTLDLLHVEGLLPDLPLQDLKQYNSIASVDLLITHIHKLMEWGHTKPRHLDTLFGAACKTTKPRLKQFKELRGNEVTMDSKLMAIVDYIKAHDADPEGFDLSPSWDLAKLAHAAVPSSERQLELQWLKQYGERYKEAVGCDDVFPDFPALKDINDLLIPDGLHFDQIKDIKTLAKRSRAHRNCLVTYAEDCILGSTFMLTTTAGGVDTTFEVRFYERGCDDNIKRYWRVCQHEGPNRINNAATEEAAEQLTIALESTSVGDYRPKEHLPQAQDIAF